MMYGKKKPTTSGIKGTQAYKGETIEDKVRRILNDKEPIKDGAPRIYSERKDGVRPEYNIRTDRWEHAIDAMTAVSKTHKAKREERGKVVKLDEKKDAGGKSTEGETSTT